MTDDLKLHRDAQRAVQAQALLNDDMLKEVFAALESDYIRAWRATPARDQEAREYYWMAINVLGKVRDHLTYTVSGGKVAQKELDDLANKAKLNG